MTLIVMEASGGVAPWAVGVATFVVLAAVLATVLGFGSSRPHS